MNDFYFTPSAKGKSEITLVVFLAILATTVYAISLTDIFSRSILQLLFLLLAVVCIFLCIRYFLSYYRYSVTEENGELFFIVTQTQGKRISTLADFKVEHIKKIETAETREEMNAIKKKFASQGIRYSYVPSLAPKELTLLTVRNDYLIYKVLLQTEKPFSDALRNLVNNNLRETDAEQ